MDYLTIREVLTNTCTNYMDLDKTGRFTQICQNTFRALLRVLEGCTLPVIIKGIRKSRRQQHSFKKQIHSILESKLTY